MHKLLEQARTGDWLTLARLRAYSFILLAITACALLAIVFTAKDRLMPNDNPVGADFAQVWVAGAEALRGAPAAPFDVPTHIAAQRAEFGPKAAVYGWHYPPYFLAPAAALATLPYFVALALWRIVTLALYLGVIAWIARRGPGDRRLWMLGALAFPAVFVNLGHGQNGFLTAALLATGLMLLDRRPWLAGVALAALAYKPQFAVVLPLVLLVTMNWRAMISGGVTLVVMTLATIGLFGAEAWTAFFASLEFTRANVIEQGAAGFEKIQSVFAAARLLGANIATAYSIQTAVTLATLAALVWLWRSRADMRVKIAATMISTQLTTPYCLDYDMMVFGPALALLAWHGLERGFAPWEKSMLALGFLTPLLARPIAILFDIPFGAPATVILFAAIVANALRAEEAHPRGGGGGCAQREEGEGGPRPDPDEQAEEAQGPRGDGGEAGEASLRGGERWQWHRSVFAGERGVVRNSFR